MANLTPRDTYNPNASVSPDVASPGNYLNVQANPNETGAQVGQVIQKAGQTVGQSADEAQQYALQAQGFINEHQANLAEQDATIKGGQVYDEYKQNTGFAAVNAKDQYVQKLSDIYNKIGEGLNPAARRAYEQQSIRRLSFSIQDMNSYAADQAKSAIKTGRTSAINLSTDRVGQFSVASNPGQFGFETGTALYNLNANLTDPMSGGPYAGLPAKTNKDGTLSFDTDTPQGKIAQEDYDNQVNQMKSKMWIARGSALYGGDSTHPPDVSRVMDMLKDPGNNIPPLARAELMKTYEGPYRAQLGWQVGEDTLSHASADYQGAVTSGQSSDAIFDSIHQQESSGKTSGVVTSPDGSVGPGQIKPETFKEFAKPGEDINKPEDNLAVSKRIIQKYSADYNGDASRVAVAYFSGPGNVAPAGSPTPYKQDLKDANGKSVSSYVSDVTNRLPISTGGTQTDYLAANSVKYEDQARQAVLHNGGDAQLAEQAADHVRSRIQAQVSGQQAQIRQSEDSLAGLVMKDGHEVTSEAQLDYSTDPAVRQQWIDLQHLNTFAANAIRNMIRANAQGASKSYGTDIYKYMQQVWSGKITDIGQVADSIGGDNTPISASGANALYKEIQGMQTPQGQAFAHAQMEFLDQAHKIITGAGLPGIDGSKREPLFNKFLQSALPQIQADRGSMSVGEMFGDKKSSLWKAVEAASPTLAQIKTEAGGEAIYKMQHPEAAQAPTTGVNAGTLDINKISDVGTLMKTPHLTREQFHQIVTKHGLISTPPAVPAP